MDQEKIKKAIASLGLSSDETYRFSQIRKRGEMMTSLLGSEKFRLEYGDKEYQAKDLLNKLGIYYDLEN
ncbi:MAG: hypothetical protein Q7S18_00450 [bacterium]|nr:hypothetical protein [bacterium]